MAAEMKYEPGELVTVSRDRDRGDYSYQGQPFEVVHCEAGFVILRRLVNDGPGDSKRPVCLNLNRWELKRISRQFVDALTPD